MVKQVIHLRATRGWGPARIGPKLGLPVSTVASVIRREELPRLCDVDLANRQRIRRAVRRYDHAAAGDMARFDAKKLGVIPDGGGWRFRGRGSDQAKAARLNALGYGYLHTVLDVHSRLAHTETLFLTRRVRPPRRSGLGPTAGSPAAASPSSAV